MKKISLIILSVLIISVLPGCKTAQENNNTSISQIIDTIDKDNEILQNNANSNTPQNTNSSNLSDGGTTKTNENIQNITKEDFDINYKDTVINDSVPFKQLAGKLVFELGKIDNNIEKKARKKVGNNDYSCYIVHYPSKEKEEIRFEYIKNETLNTEYLVCTDLLKIKTYRSISVGDDLGKLLGAYGNSDKPIYNTSTTDCYYYKLNNKSTDSNPDKTISIVVDKNIKKITKISINYNSNKAMAEMNIPSFD